MSKRQQKKEVVKIVLEDQVLPSDITLEQSVLGSIIIDGETINQIVQDFSPELFHDSKNKLIAEAILALYKQNKPIDVLTIIQYLKSISKLEECGGAYYVSTITNKSIGNINIKFHVKLLQQKSLERNLIHIANKAVVSIVNYKDDIFDVYAKIQSEIEDSLKNILRFEIKSINDIHLDILERNLNIIEKGIKSGVPSGFRNVDNVTNGWQKSDLIILAGRPSMGKTAAAVSLIMHPVLEQNIPVAIFSLEMSSFQIGSRIQSFISDVNVSKIVKGQITKEEATYIHASCEPLHKAPLYIDDTPNISLIELKSKSRKLVAEKKVEMIIIDYLQLMRSGLDIGSREQEIAEISRGLKALAKELNIPIIALSQLSRLVEARSDKKPMLSDLRESGQIEQDADMVVFCYRPEYYGIEQYEIGNQVFPSFGLMMLVIAKHRNGELGEIPLRFIHEQAKLSNYNVLQGNTEKNNSESASNSNKNSTFVSNEIGGKLEVNSSFLNQKNDKDLPF
jgi:replicative DNA helicase